MNSFEEILIRVDAGDHPTKIALLYPWISISIEDREALFVEAEERGHSGEQLIQVISYLTIHQTENLFDSIRSASLSFRYLPWDEIRKRRLLDWIGTTLILLEKSVLSNNHEQLKKFHQYKAEYSVLFALYYLDIDQVNKALDCYNTALDLYNIYGSKEQILKISEQIQHWKSIQNSQEHILPIDQFESERFRLQHELTNLSLRMKKQKAEEERLHNININAQKQIDNLNALSIQLKSDEKRYLDHQTGLIKDINEKELKLQYLNDTLQPLEKKQIELDAIYKKHHDVEKSLNLLVTEQTKHTESINILIKNKDNLERQIQQQNEIISRYSSEIESLQNLKVHLENNIDQNKRIIDYLLYLQSAAIAPLWIEVLKMAIKQGTIDELAISAAQRLLLVNPYQIESESILAEIVARTTNINSVEIDSFLSRSTHWMAKISQAERIKDKDFKKSSQLLIEAWESFLNINP